MFHKRGSAYFSLSDIGRGGISISPRSLFSACLLKLVPCRINRLNCRLRNFFTPSWRPDRSRIRTELSRVRFGHEIQVTSAGITKMDACEIRKSRQRSGTDLNMTTTACPAACSGNARLAACEQAIKMRQNGSGNTRSQFLDFGK